MPELHFKFRQDAGAKARREVVARLRELGARSVAPLFSKEKDPELAAFYRLECDARASSRVLRALRKEDAVELAEPAVQRRLIR